MAISSEHRFWRRRWKTQRWVVFCTFAAALPVLRPVQAGQDQPAREPAAKSAVAAPNPQTTAAQKKQAILNYVNAPWEQVLSQLADRLELPLMMEVKPPGSFTYSDKTPRTPEETLDLINGALLTRDYTLLRGRQFLALVPLDKEPPAELIPTVDRDGLPKLTPNEFASHTIQLKYGDPTTIAEEIKKTLSKHGQARPLPRLKLLTLVDRAAALREAAPLVERLDEASKPAPAAQPPAAPPKFEKVYPLERIEADKTLPVLTAVLGTTASAVAGPENRSIVLIAAEADHARAAKLLASLDKPSEVGAGVEITRKTYRVRSDDAPGLANALQNLWPRRRRDRPAGDGSAVPGPATFAADKATGLLWVEAPEAVHAQVKAVLDELDAALAARAPVDRLHRVRNADPAALSAMVQQFTPGPEVKIAVDPSGQGLMVRGTAADHERISALLEQLDPPTAQGDVKSATMEEALPLRHAQASTLAASLTTLFGRLTSPTAAGSNALTIAADASQNALLVRGPAELVLKVKKLAAGLDVPPVVPGQADHADFVYRTKHVGAGQLASLLTRLIPPTAGVKLEPAAGDSALVVSARADLKPRVEALFEMLDQHELATGGDLVRSYQPRHLSPAAFLNLAKGLYVARTDVAMTLDESLPGVLVTAPANVHRTLEALIEKLDKPGPAGANPEPRLFRIKHASGAELAALIGRLYPPEKTGLQAVFEPGNALLILRGPAETLPAVEKLLERVDIPAGSADRVEFVYRTKHLPAAELVRLVNSLAGSDPTRSAVVGGERSVLLSVARDGIEKLNRLLETLDVPELATKPAELEAYEPKHVGARRLVDAMNRLEPERPGGGTISLDPAGRMIWLRGSAEALAGMKKSLERLDRPSDRADEIELPRRVYRLKWAKAAELAKTLETAYPPPDDDRPARTGADGDKKASRPRVRITADAANSLLVIEAPEAVHAELEKLIGLIDQPSETRAIDRLHRLDGLEATTALQMLRAVFVDPPAQFVATGDPGTILAIAPARVQERIADLLAKVAKENAGNGDRIAAALKVHHASAYAVASSLQTMLPESAHAGRITYDSATNSVLVAGRPELVEKAKSLLSQLDRDPAADLSHREYRSKHLPASELVERLRGLLAAGSTPRTTATVGSDGGSIVVYAPPEGHERVAALLESLDRPPDPDARLEKKIVRVQKASASGLAYTVGQIFPPAKTRCTVTADAANNLLVIEAPATLLAEVEKMIQSLDRPPAAERVERTYALKHARADRVVSPLSLIFYSLGTVQVQPTGDGRGILVSAPVDLHERIAKVVDQLDRQPDPSNRIERVFRLEHATASSLVASLRTALTDAPGAQFIPDDANRTIVASVDKEFEGRVEKLIREADQPAQKPDRIDRVVGLRHATASSLASSLQYALADVPDARFVPDNANRTITISAPQRAAKRIEELIEQADRPGPAAGRVERVFRLEHATASSLAVSLRTALTDAPGAQFIPDDANRTIVASVDKEFEGRVEKLIREADQPAQKPDRIDRVVGLRHATASSLASSLQYALADVPDARFVPDNANRTITISAPQRAAKRIEELIEQADRPGPSAARIERVYRPDFATPSSLARALQLAFADQPDAQFIPDDANRALMASIDPRHEPRVQALIAAADKPKSVASRRIAVLPLAVLEPFRVEPVLRRMFDADAADVRPTFESTDDPPQLIVRGTPEQVTQIRNALIELGEPAASLSATAAVGGLAGEPATSEPFLRSIRIERASPRATAAAIAKLWPRLRKNPMVLVDSETAPLGVGERKPSEAESKLAEKPPDAKGEAMPGDAKLPVTLTPGNRRLIVSSKDRAAVALVERLAETLLEEPQPGAGEFRVFNLDHADAAEVAKSIDESLNGRSGDGARRRGLERVRVVADPASNALILRAGMVDLAAAADLIAQLDRSPAAESTLKPRVVQLHKAKADDALAVLKEVYAGLLQPGTAGPQALPGFTARGQGKTAALSIGVDRAANALVVSCSDAAFEQVKSLVEELDRTAGEPGRTYRLIPVRDASPLDVEEALELLLDRPSSGTGRGAGARPARTRTTTPRPTRPRPQRRPGAAGDVTPRPSLETERKTIETASTSTDNAGKPGRLPSDLIARDLAPAKESGVGARGLALGRPVVGNVGESANSSTDDNARRDDAVQPAGWISLTRQEKKPEAGAAATDGPSLEKLGARAELRGLSELGAVLLLGSEFEVEALARLVRQMEGLARDGRLRFKVLPLSHAKASAAARLVDELFGKVLDSRASVSRVDAQAQVIPLAQPNALLLAASKEDIEFLTELARTFDVPAGTPAGDFAVLRLKHARAGELARTLENFFANRAADGELAPEILLEPDPRSNALVVHAGPGDLEQLKALVNELDTPETALVSSLKVFPLRYALAEEVARALGQAIGSPTGQGTAEGPAAGQRTRPALELLVADPKSGSKIESAILQDVRITPIVRANSLIVSAPAKTLGLIEALIGQLDRPPDAQAVIKVFTLVNSDAAAMALVLRTLFSGSDPLRGSGPLATRPPQTVEAGSPASGDAGSPLVDLSFAVDVRTNSVLVSGSVEALELVEAVLLRLDGSNVEERKTEVIKLKNALAGEVAAAIGDLLARQAEAERASDAVSLRRQIDSEVAVVPESASNSLLVSCTPRFYPRLLALIDKLDEPPPQVVIQVLIVQVDLDRNNELGIELGLQDSILFQRGIFPGVATLTPTFTPQGVSIVTNNPVTPGIPGFNFNSTSPLGNNPYQPNPNWVGGQGISNLGVGRSGTGGFGGLVLSASSESVNVLLRALARDQRIEVLSRPQIMALDNQTAFIQVGQQIPLIQNSVIQANVGVVNTVTYQDVGIILIVTPKIGPDGTVVLRVDPEISGLAPVSDLDSRVEISTGVFARAINTTRAQTTVAARDGQTAVLGGLIRRENEREERKVPWLGDVPVVGWAFKYQQTRCRKRELLFFLTPHVVRNPEDAERIKAIESARMNWCLKNEELAEIGLPPRAVASEESASASSGKKKWWHWHRSKKSGAAGNASGSTGGTDAFQGNEILVPGAENGLLPTTVTHLPPSATADAAARISATSGSSPSGTEARSAFERSRIDPTMWPAGSREKPGSAGWNRESAAKTARSMPAPRPLPSMNLVRERIPDGSLKPAGHNQSDAADAVDEKRK